MAVVNRIAWNNRIKDPITILSASSVASGFAIDWLKNPLRSQVWRSRLGWNPTPSFNDRLDFVYGAATLAASLTVGNYPSPSNYAAMVQAAMRTASATADIDVTYSASTGKYTIARTTGGTFQLLFGSGGNLARSAALDMGFTEANKTGASSYAAENSAYQSREWIKADLGSSLSMAVGIAINHNLAGGTMRHQGNSTDVWSAPTINQLLAGSSAIQIGYFGSSAQRYWRLRIDDVQNPAGYCEVGVWFGGPYDQPGYVYADGSVIAPQALATVQVAVAGAHFQARRNNREAYSLTWDDMPTADKDIFKAINDANPPGSPFFFSFDATDNPANTLYVWFPEPMKFTPNSGGNYWDMEGQIMEALG